MVAYTYPATGVFTAIVIASNSVNALTTTTVVSVQQAIVGLVAFNDSPTELGQWTALTATVEAGDDVTYHWDLGHGGATDEGPTTSYQYPAPGLYLAQVTALNAVSIMTANTQVVVDQPIAGLSAANDSPTTLGNATAFTATIAQGSFVWSCADQHLRLPRDTDSSTILPLDILAEFVL